MDDGALVVSLSHWASLPSQGGPRSPERWWEGPQRPKGWVGPAVEQIRGGGEGREKSLSHMHLGLTCPSFRPGRTRSGFRPTVRSSSRNCCQRSRSWSSSSRSRNGYVSVATSGGEHRLPTPPLLALAHLPLRYTASRWRPGAGWFVGPVLIREELLSCTKDSICNHR